MLLIWFKCMKLTKMWHNKGTKLNSNCVYYTEDNS